MSGTCGHVYRAFSGYTDNGTAFTYQEIGRNEDLGNPLNKKWGGDVVIRTSISGGSGVDVYISFDNSGYFFLGSINVTGGLVTFPCTFPVQFPTVNEAIGKFHLDGFPDWYRAKLKLEHNGSNTEDIKILERSILTYLNRYMSE